MVLVIGMAIVMVTVIMFVIASMILIVMVIVSVTVIGASETTTMLGTCQSLKNMHTVSNSI